MSDTPEGQRLSRFVWTRSQFDQMKRHTATPAELRAAGVKRVPVHPPATIPADKPEE